MRLSGENVEVARGFATAIANASAAGSSNMNLVFQSSRAAEYRCMDMPWEIFEVAYVPEFVSVKICQ